MATSLSPVGALLREWRQRRRVSQLALAYQCAMEYAPTIRSNAVMCGWIQDSPASRLLQTIPFLITAGEHYHRTVDGDLQFSTFEAIRIQTGVAHQMAARVRSDDYRHGKP